MHATETVLRYGILQLPFDHSRRSMRLHPWPVDDWLVKLWYYHRLVTLALVIGDGTS